MDSSALPSGAAESCEGFEGEQTTFSHFGQLIQFSHLGRHPGAQFPHVSVQLVPALHQGRHPRHPLLGGLVDAAPPHLEPPNLVVSILVVSHLLGRGGRLLQHRQLRLALVLESLPNINQFYADLLTILTLHIPSTSQDSISDLGWTKPSVIFSSTFFIQGSKALIPNIGQF